MGNKPMKDAQYHCHQEIQTKSMMPRHFTPPGQLPPKDRTNAGEEVGKPPYMAGGM